MYLSYSGYKTYNACALDYFHDYINKSPKPKPDNRVNSLYGTVLGVLFEKFYAEKLWKDPNVYQTLLNRVEPLLEATIASEIKKGGVFDWEDRRSSYKKKELLVQDLKDGVHRGLRIIKHHRLIGLDAQAEVKLDSEFGPHKIGGRADFILTRVAPHGDLCLLDGKGTKNREEGVDITQLKWYATLFRRRHSYVPNKLGFVFWRSEPERSLDWVAFSDKDLDELQEKILATVQKIEDGKRHLDLTFPGASSGARKVLPQEYDKVEQAFPANPSRDNCEYCHFKDVCVQSLKFFADKKRKSTLPGADSAEMGVRDIGFDD